MSTNLDRFRNNLARLTSLGDEMTLDLMLRCSNETETLEKEYHEDAKKVTATSRGATSRKVATRGATYRKRDRELGKNFTTPS